MKVDDGKLCLRYRVLRHDQRGTRMVVADFRLRELGLPSFSRARPDLTGRKLLRTDDAERDDAEGEKNRKNSFHMKIKAFAAGR